MTIYTVSSAAELTATLSKSQNGDVIQLAAGSYGKVQISGINIAGNVTITSVDPQNQAVINGLLVKASSGLTFSHLDFSNVVAGTQNVFQVLGSHDVALDHLTVHGPANLGSGIESALMMVRSSTNVTVSNSEFYNGWHALSMLDNNGLTVSGNYIHDIRTDGIRGGGNSNLLITRNTLTDFYPAALDHPDAIQIWTGNTTTSASNIAITDNVIVRGNGGPVQGIFMRDQVGTLPYQNVTVTGNIVAGGRYNGIAIDHVNGGTMSDNVVAGISGETSWIRHTNSTNLTVANNQSTYYASAAKADVGINGNIQIAPVTDGGAAWLSSWLSSHSGFSSMWTTSDAAFLSTVFQGTSFGTVTGTTTVPTTTTTSTTTTTPTDTTSGGSTGGSTGGTTGGSTTTPAPAGSGDDVYTVRSAADVVTEAANSGNDTVHSYIDYTLGANVENLWLEAAGLTGKGNALDNLIVGSGGVDTLYGMNGNDTLEGRSGDDFIRGGNGNDILRGDDGNDRLFGDADNDVLFGGKGNDVMTGGTGNDIFAFRTGDFVPGNMDKITDFIRGQDKLDFNLVQLSTGGDFNFIGTSQFHNVVGELRYQVQKGNAIVQGDIDGDGKADFSITLQKVTALASSDLIL